MKKNDTVVLYCIKEKKKLLFHTETLRRNFDLHTLKIVELRRRHKKAKQKFNWILNATPDCIYSFTSALSLSTTTSSSSLSLSFTDWFTRWRWRNSSMHSHSGECVVFWSDNRPIGEPEEDGVKSWRASEAIAYNFVRVWKSENASEQVSDKKWVQFGWSGPV